MLFVVVMKSELIAPCGINCTTCVAYFGYTMSGAKRKHSCPGCRSGKQEGGAQRLQRKSCAFLKKHCAHLANDNIRFCFECTDYPCIHLRKLDDRYRKNYKMSLIENLNFIRDNGMEKFLNNQKERYRCPSCGATICIHTNMCYCCSPPE